MDRHQNLGRGIECCYPMVFERSSFPEQLFAQMVLLIELGLAHSN
jgi:hypothetical protein